MIYVHLGDHHCPTPPLHWHYRGPVGEIPFPTWKQSLLTGVMGGIGTAVGAGVAAYFMAHWSFKRIGEYLGG